MKRLTDIFLLLCLVLAAVSCKDSGEERSHVLKVYNWADYIDEDVLAEFPAWYKQQTGEDIRLIYQVFDINEIMLTKIERGHEDFDVVCPSEYIIERMLKKDLLLPIDRNFGKTPDYLPNISPYIRRELNKTSQPERTTTDYAVPYMWGTAGILYNRNFITPDEAGSWHCLWNPRNKGKILMKDSYRDAYGTAIIYAHARQLADSTVTVEQRYLSRSHSPCREVSESHEAQHRRLGSRLRQGDDDQEQDLAQPHLERRRRMGHRRSPCRGRRPCLRSAARRQQHLV